MFLSEFFPLYRFRPHVDADPQKPRVAAVIDSLVAFKNNDHGAWVRGGDTIIHNSGYVFPNMLQYLQLTCK